MRTVTLVVAMLWSATAAADENGWRVDPEIFVWIPVSLNGSVLVRGNSVEVREDLKEVLEHLEAAAMARVEVWKGRRWGFMLEAMYVRLGEHKDRLLGDIDLDVDEAIFDLAFLFQVDEWPTGASPESPKLALQLYGGGRISYFKTELEFPIGVELSTDELFFDPLIGFRLPMHLSPTTTLSVRGDISGFGIGTDLTWNFLFGFEHALSERWAFKVGYWINSVDYSKDIGPLESQVDVTTHGPVVTFLGRFGATP